MKPVSGYSGPPLGQPLDELLQHQINNLAIVLGTDREQLLALKQLFDQNNVKIEREHPAASPHPLAMTT